MIVGQLVSITLEKFIDTLTVLYIYGIISNVVLTFQACDLPLYWKIPLFLASGGDTNGIIEMSEFLDFWNEWVSSILQIIYSNLYCHYIQDPCNLLQNSLHAWNSIQKFGATDMRAKRVLPFSKCNQEV